MAWTTLNQTMLDWSVRDAEKLRYLLRPGFRHEHRCPMCKQHFKCRNSQCSDTENPVCKRCWDENCAYAVDYEKGVDL